MFSKVSVHCCSSFMYVSLYVCGFVACGAFIEFRKAEYVYESKGSNIPREEEEKLSKYAWTFLPVEVREH